MGIEMKQSGLERAMGMSGYRGSPAEAEDRKAGIKVGGKCIWLVEGPNPEDNYPIATIYRIETDEDGDPRFHLRFEDDHKDVVTDREEICAASAIRLEVNSEHSGRTSIALMTDELVQQIARFNGYLSADQVRQTLMDGQVIHTNFRAYRKIVSPAHPAD